MAPSVHAMRVSAEIPPKRSTPLPSERSRFAKLPRSRTAAICGSADASKDSPRKPAGTGPPGRAGPPARSRAPQLRPPGSRSPSATVLPAAPATARPRKPVAAACARPSSCRIGDGAVAHPDEEHPERECAPSAASRGRAATGAPLCCSCRCHRPGVNQLGTPGARALRALLACPGGAGAPRRPAHRAWRACRGSASHNYPRGVPAPSELPHTLGSVPRPNGSSGADQILLGDNLELLPRLRRRVLPADLHRPAVQHRPAPERRDAARPCGDEDGERTGFQGRRYRSRAARRARAYARPLRRLPRLPRAAPRAGAPAARGARARSTSTSTTARRTTASCCSTRSSGASASSTRSSGPTTTARAPRRRWPAKHDTILVYVRDPDRYHFDSEEVDREPYMAPGLVTPEKAARGKLPTDVWWHTIVPTDRQREDRLSDAEARGHRCGASSQASSRPGDWCLDFFAGSGTLGAVAAQLGRRYVLIDSNPEAVAGDARAPAAAAGWAHARPARRASLWPRVPRRAAPVPPQPQPLQPRPTQELWRDRRAVGRRPGVRARRREVDPA